MGSGGKSVARPDLPNADQRRSESDCAVARFVPRKPEIATFAQDYQSAVRVELRWLRQALGLSVRNIADAMDVTLTQVRSLEAGDCDLTPMRAFQFAERCGCALSWVAACAQLRAAAPGKVVKVRPELVPMPTVLAGNYPLLRTNLGRVVADARAPDSQCVLAADIGMAKSSLGRLERGSRGLRFAHLVAIADALQRQVPSLFSDAERLAIGERVERPS